MMELIIWSSMTAVLFGVWYWACSPLRVPRSTADSLIEEIVQQVTCQISLTPSSEEIGALTFEETAALFPQATVNLDLTKSSWAFYIDEAGKLSGHKIDSVFLQYYFLWDEKAGQWVQDLEKLAEMGQIPQIPQ
jgi:hypothetical protein